MLRLTRGASAGLGEATAQRLSDVGVELGGDDGIVIGERAPSEREREDRGDGDVYVKGFRRALAR
jgi:hypothetical protein